MKLCKIFDWESKLRPCVKRVEDGGSSIVSSVETYPWDAIGNWVL